MPDVAFAPGAVLPAHRARLHISSHRRPFTPLCSTSRAARFDGAGTPQPGLPATSPPTPLPSPSSEASATGGGTVAFSSGAASLGPDALPSSGTFALEALLPSGTGVASVRIEYVESLRTALEVRYTGGGALDVDGPRLEAADIAGSYAGRSVKWTPGGVEVDERFTEEYGAQNSASDTLVRLPLGVSVLAQRVWSGGRFSFVCGWTTPVDGTRPVMVRSYGDGRELGKVVWRVEERITMR